MTHFFRVFSLNYTEKTKMAKKRLNFISIYIYVFILLLIVIFIFFLSFCHKKKEIV